MSNIEKIRQEFERLKKILEESTYYLDNSQQALGYSFALDDFKEFIDSLPEEQPSEDLEKAADESWAVYEYRETPQGLYSSCYVDGFKAGANWQKERDTRDMYMSDNRHFEKVYELGKNDMKEQMMKEAVVGFIFQSETYYPKELIAHYKGDLQMGDKVKIIIVKED